MFSRISTILKDVCVWIVIFGSGRAGCFRQSARPLYFLLLENNKLSVSFPLFIPFVGAVVEFAVPAVIDREEGYSVKRARKVATSLDRKSGV